MLLNAYIPPKVFPWLNLLSLGFPVLISGYILLTLFWVFSWKKRAFVFLLLGLLFFNSTIRWINYSPENREIPDLKIVSFNTRGGVMTGREDLEKYLDAQGADVILLQEDWGSKIKFDGYKKGDAKALITVFTKHEILNEVLADPNYAYDKAFGTITDIKIKGKIYRFVNVYLHPFKFEKEMIKLNGDSDKDAGKLKRVVKRLLQTFKEHQDQIKAFRDYIDNSPYPVILVGDFNSVPNSYEYYHLSKGLEDAFMKVGSGSATSFHDYKFPIRIDYVFTSPSIKPISYKVDRSIKISDHYPVISTFKLEK